MLLDKRSNPVYFANYSNLHTDRTTDIKLFDRLKDCKTFMLDKFGYIIRQGSDGKNTLLNYYNDFLPSAQEQQRIKNLNNL